MDKSSNGTKDPQKTSHRMGKKKKGHKVESAKRQMRHNIEWEIKTSGNKVERTKLQMGHNFEWNM